MLLQERMIMANIKSAIKRARQNPIRRSRNKSTIRSVRTAEKTLLKALSHDHSSTSKANTQKEMDKKDSTISPKELLRAYTSKIDKAAQKGMIKNKTASRKISRLSKRLQTS